MPIDFSSISLHALHHAELFAKRMKAQLTLLHVIEPYVDAMGPNGMFSPGLVKLQVEAQREISRSLGQYARTSAKRIECPVASKVLIGHIPTTIRGTATKIKADLIIMGTHGAGGFFENLLGSTTYRVTARSTIPVLSVPKRLRLNAYANLIFPLRDSRGAIRKLSYTLTVGELFSSKIHLIAHTKADSKREATKARILMSAVEKIFSGYGLRSKKSFTSTRDFAGAVIRYANAHTDSAIVILQDHDVNLAHLIKGSFTKRMVHRVKSPVLIIPL